MLSTGAKGSSCRTKVWKFRDQWFYAERGQCHIADAKTGDYRKVSIREFMERCRSFQQRSMTTQYPTEREEMISMCMAMVECARAAKAQGSPHSRSDRGYITRHQSKSSIVVPGASYNQQKTGGQPKIIVASR